MIFTLSALDFLNVNIYKHTIDKIVTPLLNIFLEQGRNYLDIWGEPFFIEKTQYLYHKMAESKNIYIIISCGFDSIPCDMGVEFLKSNFNGKIDSIDVFISAESPTGTQGNKTT